MNNYLAAMRRYAVFEGRASRAEFWQFTLVFIIGSFIISFTSQALFGIRHDATEILPGIWTVAHLLPSLAVTVRRLHDIDRTGWWVLVNLTGIGAIVGFVFAATPGTEGPNRFGLPGGDGNGTLSGMNNGPRFADHRRIDPQGGYGGGSAPSVAPLTNTDLIGNLERLSKLHAAGGLTDDEFAALKQQTLMAAKGVGANPPTNLPVAPVATPVRPRAEPQDEGMWR